MVDAAALIVGCGPTGLIVAHELLRRGISRRLVDFSLLLLARGEASGDRKGSIGSDIAVFDGR